MATYLVKKLTNKDEVALLKEPVPILTPLFFEDLSDRGKPSPYGRSPTLSKQY
jgi:hypothetical protein